MGQSGDQVDKNSSFRFVAGHWKVYREITIIKWVPCNKTYSNDIKTIEKEDGSTVVSLESCLKAVQTT